MADDNIRHVNCASDFRIVFAFSDGKLPDYPWRLGLKTPNTPSYNMYVASFDGTTYNNCSPLDDESIMVFVDHHRLVPGILHYYLQTDAPDSLFPDGEMNITIPGTVNIELWEGPSDGDTPPEVTVIVERLLKGDKGDKGDPGEAGQITSVTASVDDKTGTPSVNIELGGTPEKRTIDLKFSGLKGEPGEPDESFVRYDKAQDLTTSEQNTALSNIGSELFVLDIENGQATLTDAQEAALLSCKGVILRGTVNAGKEVLTKIYFSDYQGGDQVSFWAVRNNEYILQCVYTKSTKLFRFLTSAGFIDRNAVSIKKQTLNATQQEQALANLGMKVYVTDSSFLGSTLTAEELEQVVASKALLFTDTGDLFLFGSQDTNRISFYRPANNYYINTITVAKLTGLVTGIGSPAYVDKYALHFTVQNPALNATQQEQAWSNLGLDLVVLKFPEGVTSVTLTDEQDAKLAAGAAILVTVEGPGTGTGISDADNHIFTAHSFAGSQAPLFFSLRSNSLGLYAVYNKNNKTFTYNGSLFLVDGGAVRFNEKTKLTSSQQDVALSNIGLDFVHVDYSLLGTTLDASTAALVENAKGIVLTNTPENYSKAFVFLKAVYSNNAIYFNAWNGVSLVSQFSYNISTKRLTAISGTDLHFDSVRYTVDQGLTDAQKQQARTNIGVQSADELLADDDFIAQLKTKLGIG